MAKFNVEVVPIKNVYLGEGPHWDSKKHELLYVDILGKQVARYIPRTGEQYIVKIEEKGEGWGDSVPFVVPVESQQNKYVIGLGRSIRVMEWDGKSSRLKVPTKTLQIVNDNNPNGRFNDGKCDSKGRLWVGTMGYEHCKGKIDLKKGSLFKLNTNGQITNHAYDIDISNGLAWSPDDKVFYYIDSFAYTVDAYDYDVKAGTISNKRVVFDMKANKIEGIADGMCIDVDGNLWIAVFGGSKVIHVDPRTGKLLNIINLPARNITSVAFGGPNLDILYITSAQHGLTKEELVAEPAAGGLFQVRNTGTQGVSGGVAYAGNI